MKYTAKITEEINKVSGGIFILSNVMTLLFAVLGKEKGSGVIVRRGSFQS